MKENYYLSRNTNVYLDWLEEYQDTNLLHLWLETIFYCDEQGNVQGYRYGAGHKKGHRAMSTLVVNPRHVVYCFGDGESKGIICSYWRDIGNGIKEDYGDGKQCEFGSGNEDYSESWID